MKTDKLYRGGARPRDVLRTGKGLFDEHGFLRARLRKDDAKLQAVLARALPPFGVQGTAGSTIVSRPSPLPPLALHVNPVGRAESTIRTHVKHMFAKHGLSRQADLVRLVLSLGGPPASRH